MGCPSRGPGPCAHRGRPRCGFCLRDVGLSSKLQLEPAQLARRRELEARILNLKLSVLAVRIMIVPVAVVSCKLERGRARAGGIAATLERRGPAPAGPVPADSGPAPSLCQPAQPRLRVSIRRTTGTAAAAPPRPPPAEWPGDSLPVPVSWHGVATRRIQLPVSSFQFPVSSFQFPVSSFQFPVIKRAQPLGPKIRVVTATHASL